MTALVQFLVDLVRWTCEAPPTPLGKDYEGTGINAGPFLSPQMPSVDSTIVAGGLVFYRCEVIR